VLSFLTSDTLIPAVLHGTYRTRMHQISMSPANTVTVTQVSWILRLSELLKIHAKQTFYILKFTLFPIAGILE